MRSQPARGRAVELTAQPETLKLDTARAAIIVVDMQNDFGSRGGMFERAGIDISGIQRAIGPTARALLAARRAGLPVPWARSARLRARARNDCAARKSVSCSRSAGVLR